MPSLGPAEIFVILVVALLVFGPEKMPEIARQMGRAAREFRKVQQNIRSELRDVVSEFDAPSRSPGGDPVPTLAPREEPDSPAPTGNRVEGAPDGNGPDGAPTSSGEPDHT